MARKLTTVLLVAAFLGPIVAALIFNRINPSLGSGLGVPFAVLAGLALGAISTLAVTLFALRWPSIRPNYLVVAVACVITVLIFPIADLGMLSAVN